MSTTTSRSHGRGRRRLLRLAAFVVAPLAAITALAAPAHADGPLCGNARDPGGHNVCMWIDALGDDIYRVHVGIDVHMSVQDAQAIIDGSGGNPFVTKIFGADPFFDNAEFNLGLVVIGASQEAGLSADFERIVPKSWLNEDPGPGDRDELFARVVLNDPRGGSRSFRTPEWRQQFG
ncbi:hypothetical protein [Nonomuraea sp. NPDC050643]|uniref:hypothetical protein n=1 Tax=Nonomuraea sp. NPDC050643 TaxID=3155660 RepID=UPI00340C0D83